MNTKQTEALKLAMVQRITDYLSGGGLFNPELADHIAVRDLLIDCREALAEQPNIAKYLEKDNSEQPAQQQEPVAWMDAEGDVYKQEPPDGWCPPHTPLYTSPPASKPWVGLTYEERRYIRKCNQQHDAFAKAIEAKLREKNA